MTLAPVDDASPHARISNDQDWLDLRDQSHMARTEARRLCARAYAACAAKENHRSPVRTSRSLRTEHRILLDDVHEAQARAAVMHR